MPWKNLKQELEEEFGELAGRFAETQSVLDRRAAARKAKDAEYARERHKRTYVPRVGLKTRMASTSNAVRDMLLAGHTGRAIAEALGVVPQTVSVYRRKLGLGRDQKARLPPPARKTRAPLPPERYHAKLSGARLQALVAALPSKTNAQLAREFGVSPQAVGARRRALAAAALQPASARRPSRRAA